MDNIINIAISDLIFMIDSYPSHNENERFVFIDEYGNPNKYARKIGQDLYTLGGTSLLHVVMNKLLYIVDDKIINEEYWVIFDLRQLEFCWNNIGTWTA